MAVVGVVPILNALFPWVKDFISARKVKQEKKYDLEVLKATAEIERAKRSLEVEASYDVEALKQMQFSWKDEYILIVHSAPFIGSFIPVVQDYVLKGWEYVSMAPPWYQYIYIGIVLSVFGLRWYARRSTGEIMKASALDIKLWPLWKY